jgi:hypothetical protein
MKTNHDSPKLWGVTVPPQHPQEEPALNMNNEECRKCIKESIRNSHNSGDSVGCEYCDVHKKEIEQARRATVHVLPC